MMQRSEMRRSIQNGSLLCLSELSRAFVVNNESSAAGRSAIQRNCYARVMSQLSVDKFFIMRQTSALFAVWTTAIA